MYLDRVVPPKKLYIVHNFPALALSTYIFVLKNINKYWQSDFPLFLNCLSLLWYKGNLGDQSPIEISTKTRTWIHQHVFTMLISSPPFFDASFVDIPSYYNRSQRCWSSTSCSFSFLFGVRRAFCNSSNCTAGLCKIGYHSETRRIYYNLDHV